VRHAARREDTVHPRAAAADLRRHGPSRGALMPPVATIAGNTVRELTRSKLLYNLLVFAALFIAASLLVAQLTIGNWARIIVDMGLGAIEIAGAMTAIVIGVGLVAGEVQRKTILPTLAKPVPRWAFL